MEQTSREQKIGHTMADQALRLSLSKGVPQTIAQTILQPN
jgi:predicted naringenin-chalcone synthase